MKLEWTISYHNSMKVLSVKATEIEPFCKRIMIKKPQHKTQTGMEVHLERHSCVNPM